MLRWVILGQPTLVPLGTLASSVSAVPNIAMHGVVLLHVSMGQAAEQQDGDSCMGAGRLSGRSSAVHTLYMPPKVACPRTYVTLGPMLDSAMATAAAKTDPDSGGAVGASMFSGLSQTMSSAPATLPVPKHWIGITDALGCEQAAGCLCCQLRLLVPSWSYAVEAK